MIGASITSRRRLLLGGCLLLALLLAGCGNKGPLRQPDAAAVKAVALR